jgi:hypothetical protein
MKTLGGGGMAANLPIRRRMESLSTRKRHTAHAPACQPDSEGRPRGLNRADSETLKASVPQRGGAATQPQRRSVFLEVENCRKNIPKTLPTRSLPRIIYLQFSTFKWEALDGRKILAAMRQFDSLQCKRRERTKIFSAKAETDRSVHGGAVHRRVSETAGKLRAGRFLKIWARPAFPAVNAINGYF